MSMKGFYDKAKATIKRLSAESKNEIGEVIPTYEEIGKTDIRIYTKVSQYVRTETGFVRQDQWEAQVPHGTDIAQGDKITHKGTAYTIIGTQDDASNVFTKLTLELE